MVINARIATFIISFVRSVVPVLLCIVALLGSTLPSHCQSLPLAFDRGRVTVATIPDAMGGGTSLKVLRTDEGTPLRAGTAWIWSQQWQEEPSEYYAAMRGKGLNAVRIILFDTWEHEAGYVTTDWNNAAYRQAMLGRIERAVNYCSLNGLYAIINSHNKVPEFNTAYNQALWSVVAPYFRNRTNVLYEMNNESLAGTGIVASGEYAGSITRLQDLRNTYDLIRSAAPQTHIMVLTPAGISGWGYIDAMARMTRRFEQLGSAIDWTKTSVAYHLYHGDANLFPLAQNLRNFHSQYPGWPSENNFPSSVSSAQLGIGSGDSERSVSFGNDVYVTQTCERLGLGWSHWHINRLDQLNRNLPLLWSDATAKGYAWKPDSVYNDVRFINAGGPILGPLAFDINYFGGDTANNNPDGPIDLTGVSNPLPVDAYRTERWGNFTYEFARLLPGRVYRIRLHFTEDYSGITNVGQRVFNVLANDRSLLNNFDIFAAAGRRKNRAVVRELTVAANASGRITLQFQSVVQNAKVDALEIYSGAQVGVPVTPAPTVTKVNGQIRVAVTLQNSGGIAATGVRVTAATLNRVTTRTSIPINIGSINAGSTTTVVLSFPDSAAASGTRPFLSIGFTSTNGGNGSVSVRCATVP